LGENTVIFGLLRARRTLAPVLLAGALAVTAGACAPGRVPPPSSPTLSAAAPRYMAGMVNQLRASNGESGLQMAYDASAKAQSLAQSMADQHQIFHSSNLASGIDGGWTAIAENVAVAPTVAQANATLENSPEHRANLLGPYNQVGIGIAQGTDGQVYVAEVMVAR
jgi:uncharacterized protein YkwD